MARGVTTRALLEDAIERLIGLRGPVAAKLDTIDLAITNLRAVLPTEEPARGPRAGGRPRLVKGRRQAAEPSGDARVDVLLEAITKSPHGLTVGELRKATPKLDGRQRSNSLQYLKRMDKIARRGNAWVAA